MRKKLLFVLTLGAIFGGCQSTHLCSVDERIAVYATADSTSPAAFFIPYGKNMLAGNAKQGYRKIVYANRGGYIVKRKFSREIACSKAEVKKLYINSDSTYAFKKYRSELADGQDSYSASAQRNNQSGPLNTGNKSTRTASTPPSSGGPVQVKGYYRSNGTYVQPHTRSSPSRR
ncbi:hypothetical protein [Terrimonas ferruginea]|uniref:hypothetical protein n=1 Tax=Terrimonas ferruginea TaxID=249 RepID=UPI0012DC48E0|nr:hypothetical protein [Terrimonas ferruginea]